MTEHNIELVEIADQAQGLTHFLNIARAAAEYECIPDGSMIFFLESLCTKAGELSNKVEELRKSISQSG